MPDKKEHIAILFPPSKNKQDYIPLVRIHSECLTGDVFYSARCDCGCQLDEAIDRIGEVGGLIIYLRQEGRGIGLYKKLEAYNLQIDGHDTFKANEILGFPCDARDYYSAVIILKLLNMTKVKLITNSPDKVKFLKEEGIEIHKVVKTKTFITDDNYLYLKAKQVQYQHTLEI